MGMAETHIITRCPTCSTAFRASEAQLSARQGLVRCGRCAGIFDARAHALPRATNITPPADEAAPNEVEETAAHAGENVSVASEHTAPLPEEATAIAEDATPLHEDGVASPGQAEPRPSVSPEPLVLTPTPREALPHEMEPETPPLLVPANAAANNLAFDFGRPPHTSGGTYRWLTMSSIALLAVALALQVGFHFRGDIALLFPAVKPGLETVCAYAGCSLPLPRRADMMSIESSELQADTLNPAIMVLSATLRNRAPFAQATPALELTLTDAQDQPLARRVLTSADYVSSPTATASGISQVGEKDSVPAGMELSVKVYFDASAVQATGYRLYLFYP
jgi:predicted Zn finger-like uncharacterized protein